MRLVKLTVGTGLVGIVLQLLLVSVFEYTFGRNHSGFREFIEFAVFYGPSGIALLLGIVSGVVVIVLIVKQDIIPALVTLTAQFREGGTTTWHRWGAARSWLRSNTSWGVWRKSREDAIASPASNTDESPLDKLRQRYAAGDLTDEQFERKFERLLETEPEEGPADRRDSRE